MIAAALVLLYAYKGLRNYGKNENLLAKSILLNQWETPAALYDLNREQMRNTLIATLAQKTAETKTSLEDLKDDELAYTSLLYRFLKDAKFKSPGELQATTTATLREAVIALNVLHSNHKPSELQAFDAAQNLRIAYAWWLPQKNAELAEKLGNFKTSEEIFALKDNQGKGMDVLRIVKADEAEYTYLGVYHIMVAENQFNLFLAGSNDLKNWVRLATLGERAHQGDIEKWGDGYIVANEQDEKKGHNNIQVRYYPTFKELTNNEPSAALSIPHQFSYLFEGTPDIRHISGTTPEQSRIYIGFHYFTMKRVDKQAFGVLNNFKDFKSWKDDLVNDNITALGYKGNIGARASFICNKEEYVLLEAQTERNNWDGWRLLLGDGGYYSRLDLLTRKESLSFANPGIANVGDGTYCVTSFLPAEGQLLFQFNLNQE